MQEIEGYGAVVQIAIVRMARHIAKQVKHKPISIHVLTIRADLSIGPAFA